MKIYHKIKLSNYMIFFLVCLLLVQSAFSINKKSSKKHKNKMSIQCMNIIPLSNFFLNLNFFENTLILY